MTVNDVINALSGALKAGILDGEEIITIWDEEGDQEIRNAISITADKSFGLVTFSDDTPVDGETEIYVD